MHVMHVLGNLGMGGAELGVVRLVNSFPPDNFKHSIAVLGSDLTLSPMLGKEVPLHSLGVTGRSYSVFFALRRLFREQKVDLVHVNNIPPWVDCVLGARLAGCNCIETFHGVEQGALRFSPFRRGLFQLASMGSAALTAVASPAADLVAELTGIARGHIEVIPNGVDTTVYSPLPDAEEKRTLRQEVGLPSDGLLFGCVAALRPVKNHRGLLNAFASAIKHGGYNAYLVLVGDGELRVGLEAQCRELGIEQKVRFLGARTDVERLLKCFDALVLNSETEGLSYAVLEAMASGLPVIATAVGANPQLIQDGCEGWLLPQGDVRALTSCLEGAMASSGRLAGMGQRARDKIVGTFSLEAMSRAYMQLYQRVSGC